MKIITYLGFTLISILIQFSVMDFIQEIQKTEEKPSISFNTSQRKQFHDILKEYTNKPHALYYRTGMNQLTDKKNISSTTISYSNTSVLEDVLETSTETPSTTFEELYDESASLADFSSTTISFDTSTEIDNVTEFVLFEKKNNTKEQPNIVPTRSLKKEKCNCNYLFNVCDINCCCDSDCSDEELKLFISCYEDDSHRKQNDVCYPYFSSRTHSSNSLDNFFCIAKINLPGKRNINSNRYDSASVARAKKTTLKWQHTEIPHEDKEFLKTRYIYGHPIWLLKNGSVNYLDVSSPTVNNYCTGRKLVQFLKDERIICSIKLMHLEMIHILKTLEESLIISVTDRTMNASILDCSTLYCTNWSVIVCDGSPCTAYNKSLHEPFCTDTKCTYIALKMDYIFYIYDFKIINATVILYTQNVSMILPFMTQEINVRFYLTSESIDQAIQFSGNPGYVSGLPVIASFVENNHTDDFFNNSSLKKHLLLPINEHGKCVMSTTTPGNALQFGSNKRTNCRFYFEHNILSRNGTSACKMIHNNIYEYLGLNHAIFLSPNGNPQGLKDEEWLPLQIENIDEEMIHGYFVDGRSSIMCHNIVAKILFIFTYVDKSNINTRMENQILTASVEVTARNLTLYAEDFSAVLTVDTVFIDASKPPVYEFAGSPDLNIHLPKDFFFPFPNKAFINKCNLFQFMCLWCCVSQIK